MKGPQDLCSLTPVCMRIYISSSEKQKLPSPWFHAYDLITRLSYKTKKSERLLMITWTGNNVTSPIQVTAMP